MTLNCNRQKSEYTGALFWIRLVSGNFPEFLAGTLAINFDVVNKTPHFSAKQEPGTFILHINKAKPSDTGVYYCIKVERQTEMTFLNGTLLRIKGKYNSANGPFTFFKKRNNSTFIKHH